MIILAVLGTEADDSHTELRGDAMQLVPSLAAQPESMRMLRAHAPNQSPINYPGPALNPVKLVPMASAVSWPLFVELLNRF